MTLTLKLYTGKARWATDNTYIIAENDPLAVQLNTTANNLYVSAQIGKAQAQVKVSNAGVITLPDGFIAPGKLCMTIQQYVDDTVAQEWHCDPLKIVQLPNAYEMTPWELGIEQRIQSLESATFGQSFNF